MAIWPPVTANLFYKILVDNHNEIIVFSDKAIHYKNSEYIPNVDSPFYRKAGRRKRSDFLIPADFLFLDKNNYLWFAYDAGEWGGDVVGTCDSLYGKRGTCL